jgi:hypothetical protein
MRILSCFLLFGVVLGAQTGTKAKPAAAPGAKTAVAHAKPGSAGASEAALRARIKGFYQTQVEGKFRQGDEFVAPDSKDSYFEMEKERLLSFEIQKVSLRDNNTRAEATVICEVNKGMPMGGTYRLKIPRVTFWKLIRGSWYWYTVQTSYVETPFGRVKKPETGAPGADAPGAESLPKGPGVNDVLGRVVAEQNAVRLHDSEPSTGEVMIKNSMTGSIRLTPQPFEIPGLEMKLEKDLLGVNERTKVLFSYTPPEKGAKPAKVVYIQVEPTGEMIPVQVVFTPAAPVAGK